MTKKNSFQLAVIFWLAAAVNITGIFTGITTLHFITKPLLIPLLILWLFFSINKSAEKSLLLTGLFFSWLGDVFLLFENKNSFFFIAGLICFLTTHIFYIIYFFKIDNVKPSLLQQQPLLLLLVILYGISLVWFLFPYLNSLKIPVIIYAAVICTMLLCSMQIFFKVKPPANLLYLAGALLFVLSDSLLAINKFYQPFLFVGVLIMLTYCAAQFCIVKGFINQHYHEQD